MMLHWIKAARFTYNAVMNFMFEYVGNKPTWKQIREMWTRLQPDWMKDVPFQIKAGAIKAAHKGYWDALTAYLETKEEKLRLGTWEPFSVNFRSRKDPVQSCYIPKDAFRSGNFYPSMLGKNMKSSEGLPSLKTALDSTLVFKGTNAYILTPSKKKQCVNSSSEKQARIVAIDPGIRKFISFYSEDSCGFIGEHDFSRIQRLTHFVDTLISKRDLCTNKQKKKRISVAIARMRLKMKNLVTELHQKAALFLVQNFDVILLPTFETQNMVLKCEKRCINKKSVRNLLTFSHYKFKQFLKHKAYEYGKVVIDCCEAYTSKTHPETGEIKKVGSSKTIKLTNGSKVDRDIVGARNILLRALVDTPELFKSYI